MGITKQALQAFKNKGYKLDTRVKPRPAVNLIHAVFSGYIRNADSIADTIKDCVEKGAILQTEALKGYLFLSYPDTNEGKELFTTFQHDLTETGNYLRYIGNSDRLFIGKMA